MIPKLIVATSEKIITNGCISFYLMGGFHLGLLRYPFNGFEFHFPETGCSYYPRGLIIFIQQINSQFHTWWLQVSCRL